MEGLFLSFTTVSSFPLIIMSRLTEIRGHVCLMIHAFSPPSTVLGTWREPCDAREEGRREGGEGEREAGRQEGRGPQKEHRAGRWTWDFQIPECQFLTYPLQVSSFNKFSWIADISWEEKHINKPSLQVVEKREVRFREGKWLAL